LIDRSTLSNKALCDLTDPMFSLWVARHGEPLLGEAVGARE
jgi:hypothetical protein